MRPLGKTLGQRVAGQRRLAGLTQAQLAEKVGTASETISRLETGAATPSLAKIGAVADALGIDLYELFRTRPLDNPEDIALKKLIWMMSRRTAGEIVLVTDLAASIFAHTKRLRATDGG